MCPFCQSIPIISHHCPNCKFDCFFNTESMYSYFNGKYLKEYRFKLDEDQVLGVISYKESSSVYIIYKYHSEPLIEFAYPIYFENQENIDVFLKRVPAWIALS